MRRGIVLALACAACTSPRYGSGHLRCADQEPACPSGFYCADDQRCWLTGDAPDLDAATFDGGGRDLAPAPTDAGPSPSLCGSGAMVLLCDGFEAAAIDPQWTVSQRNGAVLLDATRAYRGTRSLHVHTDPSTGLMTPDASLHETRTFPLALGTIYLRAWVYVKGPLPSTGSVALFNLVDNAAGGVEVDSMGGHLALNDNSKPTSASISVTRWPSDRWFCLQVALPQGAATGTVSLFLDGSELQDARLSNATLTQIVAFYFGLQSAVPQPLPALDAWFDEIIVDDKPTTCAQ